MKLAAAIGFALALSPVLAGCATKTQTPAEAAAPAPLVPGAPAEPVKVDVPSGLYKLERTHSSVLWRVSHMGMSNYTARFAKFDAAIDYDSTDPLKSKLTATVDPKSVRTDYPGTDKNFDEEIAGENFFNAAKFPAVTFTSTSLEFTGGANGKLTGDMEILGVKKPVTFDVTLNGTKNPHPFAKVPALGFSAVGKLKRSDFGMTYFLGGVGDEVEIIIQAEFLREGDAPAKGMP